MMAYLKIESSGFDDLLEEFRLVYRDLEWIIVDFTSGEFLDRKMYFSWDGSVGNYRERICVTFNDPRPFLDGLAIIEETPFDSYVYGYEFSRQSTGLGTFALTPYIFFGFRVIGESSMKDGKFFRKGFELTRPSLFRKEVANWPRQEIKFGIFREIFGESHIFTRNGFRGAFNSSECLDKKREHLKNLGIRLGDMLSDLLLMYLPRVCHRFVADYFLGA